MNNSILAAVAVEPNKIELREFPFPDIPPDGGLLKVEIVGVCGTDVTYFKKSPVQRVLGHHVVGYIEKIGEVAAQRWGVKEGDRVAMEEYIPCGHCILCRTGQFRLCEQTDPKIGGLRYGVTPFQLLLHYGVGSANTCICILTQYFTGCQIMFPLLKRP